MVLGERLQVLQQNVGSCCAETDVNGSWREAAGSAAERRVTDRQRGLSEFIYRMWLLMISQVCFIAFYTFLIIICIGLENAATLG
jgi:hypothetical protein